MRISSKSLWGTLASLMLAVGLATAGVALADDDIETADYHQDSNFDFCLSVSGTTAGTAGERKGETSPLMIYPTLVTMDQCRVYGEGSTGNGVWASGSWLTVNGYGTIYSSDVNQRLILRTYIKERGYTYARLTAWKSSGSGWIKGSWSPDSYEKSTDVVINAGSH